MENSYFLFTKKGLPLSIERFHICSWEFNNDTSLIEFGMEVGKDSISGEQLSVSLFIPWLDSHSEVMDLYNNLSIATNSRFIFNESVSETASLDGGRNKLGVIHKFSNGTNLCILPIAFDRTTANVLTINIDLQTYKKHQADLKPNIYFRFCIKPTLPYISMRKKGISRSTIIYDLKLNERRNIPDSQLTYFNDKEFCKVNTCYVFTIVPNKYDIVFFDSASLKSIRTLEYDAFNKYLGDSRVKKDELIVVFNKKQNSESFSFFSVYSKERIGTGHFALAMLMNIACGILLFIPAYRKSFTPALPLAQIWNHLPPEIFAATAIVVIISTYFLWPAISIRFKRIFA